MPSNHVAKKLKGLTCHFFIVRSGARDSWETATLCPWVCRTHGARSGWPRASFFIQESPIEPSGHNRCERIQQKVVVKKWKIDPGKKKIILNLLRCPVSVSKILADHYDAHKHAQSGEGLVGFVLEYIMFRKINLRKLWLLWILMVHKKSKHILIWTI